MCDGFVLDEAVFPGCLNRLFVKARCLQIAAFDAGDLGDLASSDPDQFLQVCGVFGRLLARAHGLALTEDGVLGWTAIAPVLGAGFPDEVASFASADAAQVLVDYQSFQGRDLPSLVLPAVHQ